MQPAGAEYEEILDETDYSLGRDGEGRTTLEFPDGSRIPVITSNGNPTKPAAVLGEEMAGADSRYSWHDLIQGYRKLEAEELYDPETESITVDNPEYLIDFIETVAEDEKGDEAGIKVSEHERRQLADYVSDIDAQFLRAKEAEEDLDMSAMRIGMTFMFWEIEHNLDTEKYHGPRNSGIKWNLDLLEDNNVMEKELE